MGTPFSRGRRLETTIQDSRPPLRADSPGWEVGLASSNKLGVAWVLAAGILSSQGPRQEQVIHGARPPGRMHRLGGAPVWAPQSEASGVASGSRSALAQGLAVESLSSQGRRREPKIQGDSPPLRTHWLEGAPVWAPQMEALGVASSSSRSAVA